MVETKAKLSKLKVKAQFRYSWVGTEIIPTGRYEYLVCFYRAENSALQCLLSVNSLFDWIWPTMPQDLCFFRENTCWFCSISHEKQAILTEPTNQDIEFFEQLDLVDRSKDYSDESPAVRCQAPECEQSVNNLDLTPGNKGKNGTPNQALPT